MLTWAQVDLKAAYSTAVCGGIGQNSNAVWSIHTFPFSSVGESKRSEEDREKSGSRFSIHFYIPAVFADISRSLRILKVSLAFRFIVRMYDNPGNRTHLTVCYLYNFQISKHRELRSGVYFYPTSASVKDRSRAENKDEKRGRPYFVPAESIL